MKGNALNADKNCKCYPGVPLLTAVSAFGIQVCPGMLQFNIGPNTGQTIFGSFIVFVRCVWEPVQWLLDKGINEASLDAY